MNKDCFVKLHEVSGIVILSEAKNLMYSVITKLKGVLSAVILRCAQNDSRGGFIKPG